MWDEFASLKPIPSCTCEAAKAINEYSVSTKLIQFLMGLNEPYENARGQILLHDPLPGVDKAYSMILQVEKQKGMNVISDDQFENTAMLSRDQFNRKSGGKLRIRQETR